ncbi:xanthine dehydrogenase molybdopterin-binding subunit B [Rhizobium mesoamericanum]|uniref:hypothetical protein n=1 Tax=Rhizobium mesoamericanum TaxID=1079800 RepID=UPI00278B46AD|nr:hypothetical protein [Rhizobium mesoamericanum]MDQ0559871.1 xanthine dehydrogenase molybdopterin-binding subunit B [Rhizobium mesoamericanum]
MRIDEEAVLRVEAILMAAASIADYHVSHRTDMTAVPECALMAMERMRFEGKIDRYACLS